jgi:hypothetical protein
VEYEQYDFKCEGCKAEEWIAELDLDFAHDVLMGEFDWSFSEAGYLCPKCKDFYG